MASVLVCDGCGSVVHEQTETLGIVVKRDYCESCAGSVRDFLSARDDLHTDLSEKWGQGMEALTGEWRKLHPNGRLPDE